MCEKTNFIYTKEELKNKPRVFKINEKYYLKQNNEVKLHIGHRLQKLFYKIRKEPLLYPTVLSKKQNPILFETERIEKFQKGRN